MDESDEQCIRGDEQEVNEDAASVSNEKTAESAPVPSLETGMPCAKEPHKRKNNSKPVECMDLDGNLLYEFKSGAAASTELNLTQGDISQCCRGIKDSAGGYKFRFKDIDYFQAKPVMNPKRLAMLLDSMDVENSIHGGVDIHNFGIGMRSRRRDSGGRADDSFDGYGGESYSDLQGLAYTMSDLRRKILEGAKRPCAKWTRADVEFGANQLVLKKWVSENAITAESKDSSSILAGHMMPKPQLPERPERRKYARVK